jgi:hypothetical protein
MRGCETRAMPGGPQGPEGAGMFGTGPVREAGRRPGHGQADGRRPWLSGTGWGRARFAASAPGGNLT